MITRRGLISSLAVALAAPAIIRTSGLLMPVRGLLLPKRPEVTLIQHQIAAALGVPGWYDPTMAGRMRAVLMPGVRAWHVTHAYVEENAEV